MRKAGNKCRSPATYITGDVPTVGLCLIDAHWLSVIFTELHSIWCEIDFDVQSVLEDDLQVVAFYNPENGTCEPVNMSSMSNQESCLQT